MYVTLTTDMQPSQPVSVIARPAQAARPSCVKKGAYLYLEGDPAEWLYQVTSGVLRLTRLLENGRRQVIAFGYPGDIVGFPAAGLHHADCDVLEDACLQPYRLSALETGDGDPELHLALLQAALREISEMHDHLMMLGRKSASERIASFLCVLADRVGRPEGKVIRINLPMTRADIADFLGLTTETVSRTLTQFRKSGVIDIEQVSNVLVKDADALMRQSLGARE